MSTPPLNSVYRPRESGWSLVGGRLEVASELGKGTRLTPGPDDDEAIRPENGRVLLANYMRRA